MQVAKGKIERRADLGALKNMTSFENEKIESGRGVSLATRPGVVPANVGGFQSCPPSSGP
eukprot:COSAG04_NODE_4676_length_1953_cov_5.568501_4_plen_60_part_00